MNRKLKTTGLIALLAVLGLTVIAAHLWLKKEVNRTTVSHLFNDLWGGKDQTNLLMGSSSAAQMKTDKYLECGPWLNRGIGSARLPDLARYIKYSPIRATPRHIMIYAGENDVSAGLAALAVLETYTQFIASLTQRFPDSHLHILAVKPSPRRQQHQQTFERLNKELEMLAESLKNTSFYPAAWSPSDIALAFQADGVHLNDFGYHLLTSEFNQSCR